MSEPSKYPVDIDTVRTYAPANYCKYCGARITRTDNVWRDDEHGAAMCPPEGLKVAELHQPGGWDVTFWCGAEEGGYVAGTPYFDTYGQASSFAADVLHMMKPELEVFATLNNEGDENGLSREQMDAETS